MASSPALSANMADHGLDNGRLANTMLVTDDLTTRSHSYTRPSRLTARGATGTRSRSTASETRIASGSRIRNPPRSPFEDTGSFETCGARNDSVDWHRGTRAGHGDSASRSSFEDDGDTVKMSTWAGQPRVEGSSETVRMVLLTCVSIGITSVHMHCVGEKSALADSLSAASPGVSR
jgi:hypothetical protein